MTVKREPRIAYPDIREGDTILAEWDNGKTHFTAKGVVAHRVDDSYGGYVQDEKKITIGPTNTTVPDYWLVDRPHFLEGSEYGDAFEYISAQQTKVTVTYFREDGWVKEFSTGLKKYSTILTDAQARATFDNNNGRPVK